MCVMDRNEVDHTTGESKLDIVQLYMAWPWRLENGLRLTFWLKAPAHPKFRMQNCFIGLTPRPHP